MNNAKGVPPRIVPPAGTRSTGAEKTSRSGRTAFDDRGNAVWEWQTEDGDFSTDVSTQRLKKLEAPELSLEETQRLKKLNPATPKEGMLPGGGFNPYDRGTRSGDQAPRTHQK